MQAQKVDFSEIKYLLVTHSHPDHAGLAQELKNKGMKLVVMESQAAAMPALRTYMKPAQHYIEINLNDNLALTFDHSRAFLKSLGLNGNIIATPGHSDNSVWLILDEGLAFIGDLTGLNLRKTHAANSSKVGISSSLAA